MKIKSNRGAVSKIQKFISRNFNHKILIALACLGCFIPVVKFIHNRNLEKSYLQYMQNHDDALIVMDELISLSKTIQTYHNKLYAKKNKEKLTSQDCVNASLACEYTLAALKGLANPNESTVKKISFSLAELKSAFEKESEIETNRGILIAVFQINNTVDTSLLTKIRHDEKENETTKKRALKQLQDLFPTYFIQNRDLLTAPERCDLRNQIESIHAATLAKFNNQADKTKDSSKISMFTYEWMTLAMYGALMEAT